MATFKTSQAVNMTTGLSDIDSDVSLSQLIAIDPTGAHQFWDTGTGRGMSFDMSFSPPDFSTLLTTGVTISLNQIHQFGSNISETNLIWEITGVPFDIALTVPSFVLDNGGSGPGGSMSFSIVIQDFWQASASVSFSNYEDPNTYVFGAFNDSFLPGGAAYANSFVPFILRQTDSITGSTGSDLLLGYGGNDVMNGGLGNDTMDGGVGNDLVKGGGGTDVLKGLGGADRLYGGAGNDKLTGGVGADKFYFDTALASNVDTILDFSHAQADKIVLDMTIFTKFLAPGALGPRLDIVGDSVARDGNDWIIYNPTSGALFYDKDGSGTTFAPAPFRGARHHDPPRHARHGRLPDRRLSGDPRVTDLVATPARWTWATSGSLSEEPTA